MTPDAHVLDWQIVRELTRIIVAKPPKMAGLQTASAGSPIGTGWDVFRGGAPEIRGRQGATCPSTSSTPLHGSGSRPLAE